MACHLSWASVLPFLIPGGLLGVWLAATHTGMVPSYLLPSPYEVLRTAFVYIVQPEGSGPFAGRFVTDAYASLTRVALGFGCAVLVGLPLGIVSGRLWWASDLLNATVNGLRAIPGITWLPMAMVWFGVGTQTTVFLVALAAFFPIYLNAAAGAAQISPLILRSAAMMGIGGSRFVFSILIPASMPHILTGLRLGLGLAWAYLVLGELTGVPDGLGAVIMDARMLGQVNVIVVGMILIGVIGRLSDVLLVRGLRLTMKSVRRMN